MREGYYYLVTSLPDLSLTDKNVGFDVVSFRHFISDQISATDRILMQTLFYNYDIENLVTLIKNTESPWHPYGNFTLEEMTVMLSLPETLPAFMQQFVDYTNKSWSRLSTKTLLNNATTEFIDWSRQIRNQFLAKWLYFDQNLKNLLIWLNCEKFGLDPKEEVLGNHFEAEYLRSTKQEDIDLSAWDFQFREVLRHFDNSDIALREMIINDMRWHYLDEISESYPFGIESLLAFAIRLQLINRNLTDMEVNGQEKLNFLIHDLTSQYTIPEKYTNIK